MKSGSGNGYSQDPGFRDGLGRVTLSPQNARGCENARSASTNPVQRGFPPTRRYDLYANVSFQHQQVILAWVAGMKDALVRWNDDGFSILQQRGDGRIDFLRQLWKQFSQLNYSVRLAVGIV